MQNINGGAKKGTQRKMSGMKSLPLDEAEKIIHALPVRYAAIAAIGVTTGCRVGEILLLRRYDLLDPAGKIKDRIPFQKFKKKGGKEKRQKDRTKQINRLVGDHRFMAIPERFRKYIALHLKLESAKGYDRPDDFVFRGKLGKPMHYDTVYRKFRSVLGEGYGTHWMRKTFAQLMFSEFLRRFSGDRLAAAEETRKALGHARIDTTIKYLGLDESSITEAQNAVFGGR